MKSVSHFDNDNSVRVILPGDEVAVIADHHVGIEGFLDVNRGSLLEVKHVNAGNIFCAISSRDHHDCEVGWLRRTYVSRPRRSAGDLLVVRQGTTQPYCPSIPGDILEVISEADVTGAVTDGNFAPERLWCQNQRNRSLGWIPLANIQNRMSDSEARKWKQGHWNREHTQLEALRQYRKMEIEAELLPFPTPACHAWKSYQMMVPEGHVVELLEQSDDWTKIKLSKILGWVPNSSLSLMDPTLQPVQQAIVSPAPPAAPVVKFDSESDDWSGFPSVPPVAHQDVHNEVHEKVASHPLESHEVDFEVPTKLCEFEFEVATGSTESPAHTASPERVKRHTPVTPVTLSSFGIETLDHELTQRCQRLGGGARCAVPESEVAAALRRRGVDANLILDARDFPDPNSWALSKLGHSGRHYQIVGNLFCHRNFWYWLKDAKARFRRELEKSPGDISVAIYCRRGKHRSVAATVILRHILESEGFECYEWHMSQAQWCCKLDCDVCSNPPEEMKGHLDQAFNYWCSF